jgi:hypothetical protein
LGKTSIEISLGTSSLGDANTKQEKLEGGKRRGKDTSSGI